jgi:hypothetical protein
MSNPTSNFGWQMPTPTDLVTDLPADFEVFGQAVDSDFADLLGGTTGQVLSKTSNTDLDFTWVAANPGDITGVTAGTGISGGGTSGTVTVTNDMATTITAAGDIVIGTGSGTYDNLPIGTTNQILTADTTVSPYKVKWATPASGSDFTKTTSGTFSVSASNFAIDNCFSSTYKNYKVIFTFTSATQSPARWGVFFRFRTSGTDNTATNYRYTNLQYAFNGGALEQDSGNDVSYSYVTSLDNGLAQLTLDFINPFASNVTYVSGFQSNKTKAGFTTTIFNGTTSFDGFKFGCDQATVIAGEYAVYGYGN